jgi:hypothetical protein
MKAEEYGLDFTVTLTAEDAKFTDEAVAAGIPLIVVCMCRDALRKLVASEREARASDTPPQREWVGLTDEEKKAICQEAANEDWTDLDVINATEAKLKEKNNG